MFKFHGIKGSHELCTQAELVTSHTGSLRERRTSARPSPAGLRPAGSFVRSSGLPGPQQQFAHVGAPGPRRQLRALTRQPGNAGTAGAPGTALRSRRITAVRHTRGPRAERVPAKLLLREVIAEPKPRPARRSAKRCRPPNRTALHEKARPGHGDGARSDGRRRSSEPPP